MRLVAVFFFDVIHARLAYIHACKRSFLLLLFFCFGSPHFAFIYSTKLIIIRVRSSLVIVIRRKNSSLFVCLFSIFFAIIVPIATSTVKNIDKVLFIIVLPLRTWDMCMWFHVLMLLLLPLLLKWILWWRENESRVPHVNTQTDTSVAKWMNKWDTNTQPSPLSLNESYHFQF